MIGSIIKFILARLLPALLLAVAIILGWLNTQEIPAGTLFATVIPLLKGVMPPTLVGHGKMKGTPPVPDDLQPQPRPENEMFLELAGTGDLMPQAGIGMCCRPTAYDDVLVERTILWYLLQGGRLIDTAHLYLNHRAIGRGIKEAMRRGVPRSEIFVTTKIFPTHFGYNKTLETVPKYLEELDLEYIDMILMHMPTGIKFLFDPSKECIGTGSSNQCRKDTFQALSELRSKGVMRNVGVSNFAVRHIEDIVDLALQQEGIAPIAANQIQYNPWSPQSWVDTFDYCQRHGIAVTAYSSLGGMFQHSLASTEEALKQIAEAHDRSVSQIMLRWALQINAAVIPGTGNPKHMRENLEIFSFALTDEEMTTIDALRSDESAKKYFSMEPMD